MAIPVYLEDYAKESERRRKDQEAKLKAYQKHEKERASIQAKMHTEHMKAMEKSREEMIRRSCEHTAKVSAFNKTFTMAQIQYLRKHRKRGLKGICQDERGARPVQLRKK